MADEWKRTGQIGRAAHAPRLSRSSAPYGSAYSLMSFVKHREHTRARDLVDAAESDEVDGARSRHRCAIGDRRRRIRSGAVHMQIDTIGIDLAKNVFQVHGVDATHKPVLKRQLRRRQVVEFFNRLPPCRARPIAHAIETTIVRVSTQPGPTRDISNFVIGIEQLDFVRRDGRRPKTFVRS
jgi:hypothetical protein